MKTANVICLTLFILSGCSHTTKTPEQCSDDRKAIIADSGMVVSAHAESSRIGIAVMHKGGNAIDAAVATGFALAVCYPEAGNLGGGGFMLIRLSDGKTDLIDYREKAPAKAYDKMFLDNNGNVIEGLSTESHLAAGVPGSVDGLVNVHSKYGELPFSEVIQPAIDLARNGFPLKEEQANSLNKNREKFISRNVSVPPFVSELPWKTGDTLRQPLLAETLERIRDFGRDGFYAGKTARLIVREMERGGGLITEEDLINYQSVSREPLYAEYRDYKIITAPPPSGGGIILLQILEMIEKYPLREYGFHSSESVHLMAEAERRAFADRSFYYGDPDFMKVPADAFLSTDYLSERMSSFNHETASLSSEVTHGDVYRFFNSGSETTHYSVVDPQGNAVSATTTLNGSYGNFIVVDSAGFLLNNEMDDFSIKPGFPNIYGLTGGHTNAVQPGKRMLSSMTPSIVEEKGKLFIILGSPGGSTIPTSVMQVIVNVIDFGMNISDAVNAGRFHHQWLPDHISFEEGSLPAEVVDKLKNLGHKMMPVKSLGRVNAIMLLDDGRKASGADKRGDNAACGY